MAVLLQLLALLQFFLPGCLFLRLLNLRRNLLRTALLSFALSGLFNYAIILLLYPFGLFTREAVLILLLLEFILLYLTRNQITRSAISLTSVEELLAAEDGWKRHFCFFFFRPPNSLS